MAEKAQNSTNNSAATTEYYRENAPSEVERLQLMAAIADKVSHDHINDCLMGLGSNNPVIVDIGSGESTSLGENLQESGALYLPVDMRRDAVEKQKEAGFNAIQSMATGLDVMSNTTDVVHSRFTWGWLSDNERNRTLTETLRIGKEDMALVIIDYDWSVIEGPEQFVDAIENVKRVMRQFGFEPDYGSVLETDVHNRLNGVIQSSDNGDGPAVKSNSQRLNSYQGDLEGALPIICQTAEAIIDQLRIAGMQEEADKIIDDFVQLNELIDTNPDVQVKLPDIVSTSAVIKNKNQLLTEEVKELHSEYESSLERMQVFGQEHFREGHDYSVPLSGVSGFENVGIALSPALTLAARRVQANAYVKDNIVGYEAIGEDGALRQDNDPISLVQRSRYYVSLSEQGRVKGSVRAIDMLPSKGIISLPTFERLMRHCPDTIKNLEDHPIMQKGCKVLEVSALSKDPIEGNLMDVVKAILMLAEVSNREGYDYGIMGLQKSRVSLIQGIFGSKAFKRLGGDDAEHLVELPGVNETVQFVPSLVDGEKFIQQVYDHATKQCQTNKKRHNTLFKTLISMTEKLLADRKKHAA